MTISASTGGLAGRRPGFRHLAAATVGLVYATVLLGVATKATGSGLACAARWPLCDGGFLDLFPATLPSFFEWIHRVVAGVTGVFILGVAVAAWRLPGVGRPERRAATLGLLLLPVQVALGRETVRQFTGPVLAAHYWTAMAIFGSVVVVAVVAWRGSLTRTHAARALGLAAVLLPLQVVVGPGVVATYSPPLQAVQYAVTLLLFAAILLAALVARTGASAPVRYAIALALVLVPVLVLLGRNVPLSEAGWLLPAHDAVAVALFGSLVFAAVGLRRTTRSRSTATGA